MTYSVSVAPWKTNPVIMKLKALPVTRAADRRPVAKPLYLSENQRVAICAWQFKKKGAVADIMNWPQSKGQNSSFQMVRSLISMPMT